ncbi:efflux RND transporter permease subunit [Candidatus Nomurabacteria bacterium]|nr:efflux RND transporter permease subunit [Candidatus Nomurabacteria bacterium]
MNKFWSFFLNNKNFSFLILIALIFFGFQSLLSITRESAPEVIVPVAIVTTPFPGASAIDVEKLVTNKLEDQLNNNLDDVNSITSNSQDSFSTITVEFNADADVEKSIQDVKDEVDKIKNELPSEADNPVVSEVNFADEPIMTVSISSEVDDIQLSELVDELEDELKGIKGVSKISRSGLPDRETQIILRKESLAKFGISISEVVRAISASNSSLPVGSIEFNNVSYAVVFEGGIDSPSDLENVAILGRSGQPVYVRDIADVNDGLAPRSSFARISVDGQPSAKAVSLQIFKRSGSDVTKVSANVKEKLADLADGGILNDVNYLVSFDNGEYVNDDLKTLSLSALQTVILVMLILLLFLGWREALVAGLSIPLSFLVAFIGLKASGNTINFVSLFSLILSVGILVDSAIVITEAVHTKLKEGGEDGSKTGAAREAVSYFHYPLTSGTATTIAVFAPLFLISGVTGQFIASIPFTIIFVLIASLFVALGLVPLISSIFLKRRTVSDLEKKQEALTEKIQVWYKKQLDKIIGDTKKEKKFIVGVIIVLIMTITFPFFGIVKVIFFPPEDIDFVFVEIERPQGTILEATDLSVREVEERILEIPEIESYVVEVGRGSAFNSDGGGSGEKLANITVILDKKRSKNSSEVVEDLRLTLSDIRSADVRVFQPSGGPPGGAPVFVKFFANDLDLLASTIRDAETILGEVDGAIDVSSSIKTDANEFRLNIDRAKASQVGLTSQDVALALRTAVYGTEATTIKNIDGDTDVIVKLDLNNQSDDPYKTTETTIESIENISIPTSRGSVLVGSLVNTSLGSSNAIIKHEDQKRTGFVSSSVVDGKTSAEILKVFEDRIEEFGLPNGVEMSFGGEAEEINQSFKEMGLSLILGMILILAVLVLQFNSYRQALFIIAIVPISLIGVFVGLAVSGKALSFPSIMGFIALSGIVVNNSIILIDTMNKLREENSLMPIRDIVIKGSVSRIRPILLTTLTTVIGIIPLTYASELWSPLAFAIMFGLSFAVIITLFLVPILYSRWPGKLSTKE